MPYLVPKLIVHSVPSLYLSVSSPVTTVFTELTVIVPVLAFVIIVR